MVDQAVLLGALAEFARTVAGPYEIGDVLERLTEQTVSVLRVDGAAVSLTSSRAGLQFATATDAQVSEAERLQMRVGQGPCHDAYLLRRRVTSPDLRAEERWPAYTPTALALGFGALAGIPMSSGVRRIGALDLYRHGALPWQDEELEVAQVLADMAASYILNARVLADHRHLAAQLEQALDSRVIIEQAKGLLAERHGIAPSEAFELLRGHARDHNRRLADVAWAVVERRLGI